MRQPLIAALAGVLAVAAAPALAGEADVVGVRVAAPGKTFDFEVTVSHADTGWEHYADKWDVVLPDGSVAASRTLFHPHVGEQPFTRGLSGVALPDDVATVTIRAHDKVHGYGGREMEVDLTTGATRTSGGGS